MVSRFVCSVGCLMIACGICGAEQTAPALISPQQIGSTADAAGSTEMDVLAGKLAQKLVKDKVKSVVVVGGAGPDTKVTNLGVNLRDELNDALARQATGMHVLSTEELLTVVKQNHVLGGMIYSNAMMYWIASHAHADAILEIQIVWIKNDRADLTAQLSSGPGLLPGDINSKANVPGANFEAEITLTPEQIESAKHEYHAATSIPAATAGENLVDMPKCLQCPRPQFSRAGRVPSFQGVVYLQATVLPDGTADDVMVIRPVGRGFDSLSVDTVLKWKFKPATDSQGRPVATRVPIEIAYKLY